MFQITVQTADLVEVEVELQVLQIHLEERELLDKVIMVEMDIGLVLEQQQAVVAEVLEELEQMPTITLVDKVDQVKVVA